MQMPNDIIAGSGGLMEVGTMYILQNQKGR
jgi:hypothetical protein